jgi:hypothetical protein
MAAVAAGAALGAAAISGHAGPGAGVSTANAPTAVAGAPGGPGIGARPSGLTPLPPPYSRRSRRRFWRRTALLALLLLILSALLIGGILAQHGNLTSIFPGSLNATVTITPAHTLEQDNYLLEALPTGTPDPAQRQIAARVLTASSGTSTATANASGNIPARQATGPLKFLNANGNAVTILSTIFHGKSGVAISFNGPIVVPGLGGSLVITGFAVNAGSSGNISTADISGSCCASGVSVVNTAAFSGGQDAQPNSVIQQGDIDGAAHPLVMSLSQSTGKTLQGQIKSNERVVDGSFQCKPTINSNEKAGAVAKTATVQVSVTCTEEVYDFAEAQRMATSLLQAKAQNDPNLGTQYSLDGNIVTSVLSDTVVTGQGQVNIEVQAQGLWVYTFTPQMQQNIKNSLVKLSKAGAQSVLLHETGVSTAQISISSGTTMPDNASDITLNIATLPGVSSTPTGTQSPGAGSSPTVLPGTTPSASPSPSPPMGS